jgi:hypothetical protein
VSSWRGVGRGPGEQCGMCLFGMAEGAPLWEVLILRWPGGGVFRPGSGAGRARMVAISRENATATGSAWGANETVVWGGLTVVVEKSMGRVDESCMSATRLFRRKQVRLRARQLKWM